MTQHLKHLLLFSLRSYFNFQLFVYYRMKDCVLLEQFQSVANGALIQVKCLPYC